MNGENEWQPLYVAVWVTGFVLIGLGFVNVGRGLVGFLRDAGLWPPRFTRPKPGRTTAAPAAKTRVARRNQDPFSNQ